MPKSSLIDFDRSRGTIVAGADEAGRGCLAGPIVAAAVCIDYTSLDDSDLSVLSELDDSKKLSSTRRERLFAEITRVATNVAVVVRSAEYIDAFGLHRTNLHCLGTALHRSAPPNAVLLSDGYMPFGVERPCDAVVKGDSKSAAIAAASIVAKVVRDRFMCRAAQVHVGWGFEDHVGYATPAHHAAIIALGLTPLHRRSFSSVAYEQLSLTA